MDGHGASIAQTAMHTLHRMTPQTHHLPQKPIDALMALFKIALLALYPPDTKIAITLPHIEIQPHGFLQPIRRRLFGNSRDELYLLQRPLTSVVALYAPVGELLVLREIYAMAMEGLRRLKITYSEGDMNASVLNYPLSSSPGTLQGILSTAGTTVSASACESNLHTMLDFFITLLAKALQQSNPADTTPTDESSTNTSASPVTCPSATAWTWTIAEITTVVDLFHAAQRINAGVTSNDQQKTMSISHLVSAIENVLEAKAVLLYTQM
jgi:hypothetical protein